MERPGAGYGVRNMQDAISLSSGKGHRDENFPVASYLIRPRHRSVILAFYRFARAADDVADHADAAAPEKLRLLGEMQDALLGADNASTEAVSLRHALNNRHLSSRHALDLLEAFRRDVTKLRYSDWNDLMDYCRYSAMPVGRFVLDVHGELPSLWPLSDALCAALQVINHLQDCGKDYRDLGRVYIPLDALEAADETVDALAKDRSSPALRAVVQSLAQRTLLLLSDARPFASRIRDMRLATEVSVIQRLAEDLARRLVRRDPLSQRVHHRAGEALGLALTAVAGSFAGRYRAMTVRGRLASSRQ